MLQRLSVCGPCVLLLLTLTPPAFAVDQFVFEDAVANSDGFATARVLMTNDSGPALGFVLALGSADPDLHLLSIEITGTVTEAVGAEFVAEELFGSSGTLAVTLDFIAPFDGQSIPSGTDQFIAAVEFLCDPPFLPDPPDVYAVDFLNGVLGDPPLDNIIVGDPSSILADTVGGTVTFPAIEPPNTVFLGGFLDVATGDVVELIGVAGTTVQYSFYYTDPDDFVQGIQMAVVYDCDLDFVPGTFSIEGTLLDVIDAEFVSVSIDNDPGDGDGCEMRVGSLFDALPPFDQQTLPPSPAPLRVGTIDVEISADVPLGTELSIDFMNGVNASESVPVDNILVVNNETVEVMTWEADDILVFTGPTFIRGDCNTDGSPDLSDGIFLIAYLFLGGPESQCIVACDVNDDGGIDIGDFIRLAGYLFLGGPRPPHPFPECGSFTDADCAMGSEVPGCP